jgi:hypothetical protein
MINPQMTQSLLRNALLTPPSLFEILTDLSSIDLIRHPTIFGSESAEEVKQGSVLSTNKSLLAFDGIKLFDNEEIFEVQRQHIITLLTPFFVVAVFLISGISLLFSFFHSKYFFESFYFSSALLFTAAFISFIQIFIIYTFMSWFYQFYIITSKRLIHVCFFRVGGFHLDEVFHRQTTPLEIDRHPQNFILDLLGIEDLYVYFQRFERPEPFIFKTPKDHIKLGELLENHSLKRQANEY